MRQTIEAGVNFAELFAGQRGLALQLDFAFAPAPRLFAMFMAGLALQLDFAFAPAPPLFAMFMAGLALQLDFAFALAPRLFATFIAGLALQLDFAFAPAPRLFATFIAGLATIIVTRFQARIVAPAVVVLVAVISKPHRLAVIVVVVALLDDAVEPFPDRHTGLARGVAGGLARFWTQASEIPRTARFHCAPNHFGRNEMALF